MSTAERTERRTQTTSSSSQGINRLSPEVVDSINRQYEDWKPLREQFDYGAASNEHVPQISFPTQNLLRMVEESQLWRPIHFHSRRAWVIAAKKIIWRTLTPFLRICLVRQQNLNDLTVSLAEAVVTLEARIKFLESKLAEEESTDNNPAVTKGSN